MGKPGRDEKKRQRGERIDEVMDREREEKTRNLERFDVVQKVLTLLIALLAALPALVSSCR